MLSAVQFTAIHADSSIEIQLETPWRTISIQTLTLTLTRLLTLRSLRLEIAKDPRSLVEMNGNPRRFTDLHADSMNLNENTHCVNTHDKHLTKGFGDGRPPGRQQLVHENEHGVPTEEQG